MNRYRELYEKIEVYGSNRVVNFDDMMRDIGVEVMGTDMINVSQAALFVYMQEQINILQARLDAITTDT